MKELLKDQECLASKGNLDVQVFYLCSQVEEKDFIIMVFVLLEV